MPNEKHVTESGETGTKLSDYERIYQRLVDDKWRSIEKEHLRALAEDKRKVDAGLFRPLSPG